MLSLNYTKRQGSGYKKDNRLQSLYGISLEQYEEMLIAQKGECKICKATEDGFKRAFAVDHCHQTGKIRGLLCHKCNTGLGNFKDNILYLESAINYLSASIDDNILT